ncbi:uncharacterized protein STAUR_3682 [Stigmatella aurantiaca DW4/3-1]|uniref:Lipoprotein n=1 Tax=Stigmatella aurantiaca (strain DW4/3-1) TaxID=378806 RepID=E3FFA3_STIAD|nr:uncharacterized protein STAUR_3682 [Stigmatella aurantiaca DW4/3-1]
MLSDRFVAFLALLLGWALIGCATGNTVGKHSSADAFLSLQQSSGLDEDDWHPPGEPLEPEDSLALWAALTHSKTTLLNFAPRRTLLSLLRPLLSSGEEVP